ncbi:hypothetical protein [Mycolicibacterium celeriflavum]|uniref:Uncharacterized protein n=1 Tax=Mycolicibacterium celeriflavum TaxID=1249101 RepID=A0A1X0BT27_MYCCF|nr:hypothetical protein [Mycolicibacterium celeriflavum]MCV7239168.1 hypothetical protein [Mycolicibacterium celeriflavum]ORA46890.1 hypothetical protein BST21_13625 [Mycolicibacterium celeriflavum]BBY44470.1 hypothetical protein MCEL_27650 [Mycolicibacterium celeriflavum]
MRLLATVLLWLVTTVLLAVAVPTMWAQRNVVDANGYATLAASAAQDPQLQKAMAGVLTTEVTSMLSEKGYDVDNTFISGVASAYTASPTFPGQFGLANAVGHRWMFTDSAQHVEGTDEWIVDLAPMLADESFRRTLGNFGVETPESLPVPVSISDTWRPGQLAQVSTWGPWVSIGATILTGLFALLTIAAAQGRGKAVAALGVSALIVGAAGWAALEVVRRHINGALNRLSGDIREVADVMVRQAEDSLHHWLNLSLAAGGVLVVLGVLVSMLGGLRRRDA